MKVAIVGRPNVGKSSLFNVFTKTRDALVHDRPGVTRDVIEGNRDGITFFDTAGLEQCGVKARDDSTLHTSHSTLSKAVTNAALNAAEAADVILFVVDGRAGLHPMDMEWAKLIRRGKKKVILLANKCESKKGAENLHEFYKLGLGEPFPVSAEHAVGLVEVLQNLKEQEAPPQPAKAQVPSQTAPPQGGGTLLPVLRIAVMGQPNVGKSTLVNRILGEERVLVMDRPGITRDVVRVRAKFLNREIEIVDTAGLRRKAKVVDDVETLAALKALDIMNDVGAVILVLDATKTIEKQSVQIAERIFEAGRILCVALNKWDLITDEEREDRLQNLKHLFNDGFSQIIKPLVVPISAHTGAGVKNMMKRLYEQWDISETQAKTSLVNRTVEKLVASKPPPMSRLKRPMKIKFAAHTGRHPNVITIHVGGASDIPDSYTRYLRRGISKQLGWESIPVVVQYQTAENPFE